jgi:glycosyltransferase involved in cell wall biosynthesis
VATNCGAYDEWIVDGETGFLIDPKKPITEWVRVLTRCAKDPNLVKRMGENLYELTEENFNMNKVVEGRLRLYEECMGVTTSK